MKKETLKKANYRHIKTIAAGEHLLQDLSTRQYEVWVANKNHASYGLIYKNTHLEFAHGAPAYRFPSNI